VTPAVCGALALAALGVGFGLAQWLYTRRLLARSVPPRMGAASAGGEPDAAGVRRSGSPHN